MVNKSRKTSQPVPSNRNTSPSGLFGERRLNVTLPREIKHWYEINGTDLVQKPDDKKISGDNLKQLRETAEKIYDMEMNRHNRWINKSKDRGFSRTIKKTGTFADKISTILVDIQDQPYHCIPLIDDIFKMTDKKRQAHIVANSLSDVLITCILPTDRRLYLFEERPLWMVLDHKNNNDFDVGTLLYLWYFEEQLKTKILEFVKFLEISANDELEHIAKSAINSMYTLVSSVPESERLIIKILCNKMGDPRRGVVASLAGHHIECLANDNPSMIPYLVRQVSDAAIKGSLGANGSNLRSYLHFLSRVPLNKKLAPVARDLISLYAVIISRVVGYNDDFDSRLPKPEGDKDNMTKSEKKKIRKLKEKRKLAQSESNNAALKLSLIGMKRAIPFAELEEYPLSDSTVRTLVDTAYNAPLHISTLIIGLLQRIGGDVREKSSKILYHILRRPDVSEHAQMKLFKCFSEIANDGKELDAKYPHPAQVALTKRLVLSSASGSIPFAVTCLQTLNDLPPEIYNSSGKFFGPGPTYVHGKENPEHSIVIKGNEKTPIWELELLRRHINPTVSLCAQNLQYKKKGLNKGNNNNSKKNSEFYTGDAYADFTFASFVERLSTRNIRQHSKRDEGLFSQFKRRSMDYVNIPELGIFWKTPKKKVRQRREEKGEVNDIDDFLLSEMRKRGMIKDDADEENEINAYEEDYGEEEEEQWDMDGLEYDVSDEEEQEEREEENDSYDVSESKSDEDEPSNHKDNEEEMGVIEDVESKNTQLDEDENEESEDNSEEDDDVTNFDESIKKVENDKKRKKIGRKSKKVKGKKSVKKRAKKTTKG